MKKKIIGSIAILVIATVAAFNIQLNTMDGKLSNISVANIEALANNENKKEREGWCEQGLNPVIYVEGCMVYQHFFYWCEGKGIGGCLEGCVEVNVDECKKSVAVEDCTSFATCNS